MQRHAIRTVWIASLFAMTFLPSSVSGHGYMTLLFKSYINNDGRCSDGTFCDPVGFLNIRSTPCDPYFRLVADKTVPGGYGLFNYQTSVYWDVDTVNFGTKFGDLANPLTIDMSFSDNPGTMQIRVTAMDKDTASSDDHMDTFSASLTALADGVRRDLEMQSPPMMSRLQVQYWYSCHTNYYGLYCNKYCAAHNDDVNGHYTCDSSGNKVCMAGWIGDSCTQPHPCISNPCINGGTCTNVGGAASCACPHGITGSRCQIDVNECAETSPCQNGGTCVNSLGGFSCSCPMGLTGSRCELDVNECSESEQCVNGGTCVNNFGNFSCQCPSGLKGRRCEQDMDECLVSSCLNGGMCVNSFGNFSCNCTEAFTGRLCEHDVNECLEAEQCENGGTCVNSIGGFDCQCPSGFNGTRCELDVNECLETSPCQNGGTCVNSFGIFSCRCQPGFTGSRCEEDVNECTNSSPCVNNGTCMNSPGNYSCLCQLQFSGRHCEIRRCDAVVCINGGTCEVAADGAARCRCRAGFRGSRCEDPDDPLDCRRLGSCENGGSCEATDLGHHECRCAPGFSGFTCGQAQVAAQASSNIVEISVGSAIGAILLVGAVIGIVVGVLVHRGAIDCRSGGSASDELPQGAENSAYMDAAECCESAATDEVVQNPNYGTAGSGVSAVNQQEIYVQVD